MDTKGKETPAPVGLNWRNKPRRRFNAAERLALVLECSEPGVSVAEVAQRNRINSNLLFKWKKKHERGLLPAPAAGSAALVPVTVIKSRRRPATRPARVRRQPDLRTKATAVAGAIEVELAGARIVVHGAVSEANLAAVLRALARR
jgi:transposase